VTNEENKIGSKFYN